jgi:hypothetical protein
MKNVERIFQVEKISISTNLSCDQRAEQTNEIMKPALLPPNHVTNPIGNKYRNDKVTLSGAKKSTVPIKIVQTIPKMILKVFPLDSRNLK